MELSRVGMAAILAALFGTIQPSRADASPLFELSGDSVPGASIYAIENTNADTSVVVTSSQLGAAFKDWFAPQCTGCTRTP